MQPISELSSLLKSMQPELNPGTYAYATLGPDQTISISDVVSLIREPEGISVIVSESTAGRLGLKTVFRCEWITLTVNSDLQAVGLTAAFSRALGMAGISCNVVAGTNHDHIFVPLNEGQSAMNALDALQASAAAQDTL